MPETQPAIDADAYCRELEAYLCRKNDGHLVRIVGPAFDRVRAWATQGIPARVACAGIDRYFERYYRRGPRRRPVRIEFCEADVLDAFDVWRRAVGVSVTVAAGSADVEGQEAEGHASAGSKTSGRRTSLAHHLEEVMARLTSLRASSSALAHASAELDATVRKLDHLLTEARKARGEARDAIVATLASIDRELLDLVAVALTDAEQAEIAAEADRELAPFKARMTMEALTTATRAATRRLVRERYQLPRVEFD